MITNDLSTWLMNDRHDDFGFFPRRHEEAEMMMGLMVTAVSAMELALDVFLWRLLWILLLPGKHADALGWNLGTEFRDRKQ